MKPSKYQQWQRRGARIRKKIGEGTAQKPRLVVFRSNTALYAQVINDVDGVTLVSSHSLKEKNAGNLDAAKKVGAEIAQKAKAAKITTVVFDRNGYTYHGKVEAFVEAAREGGLTF